MAGTKTLVVSLVLFGIFSFAFITYLNNFSSENNIALGTNNDSYFNDISSDSITNYISSANSTTESLYGLTISGTEGATTQIGGFKFGQEKLKDNYEYTLISAYRNIFGTDENFAIILTTITATILVIIGLYVWKTLKGGLPD